MGGHRQLQKRKIRLWNENGGQCHWCGIQTILGKKGGGRIPARWATIDHLRSRHNPTRWQIQCIPQEERTVLACYACNNVRSQEEELRIPIEERRRRSGYYPRPKSWSDRLWRLLVHPFKRLFY